MLEEQHENVVAAVTTCERPPMQGEKKSEREHVRVTKKFLEVSHGSRAKQRQRNVQKKCAARTKLFFFAN